MSGRKYAPRYGPDELHEQTKDRVWCEIHECALIQNAMGDWVCVVCIVEDRLCL